MALIGAIGPFVDGEMKFSSYVGRMEMFFEANDVADKKKVSVFLSTIGDGPFCLLEDLVSPKLPKACTYDELVDVLQKHFKPKVIIIYERFKFRICKQGDSTIAEYVAKLRNLARTCDYQNALEDNLLEQFIVGLKEESTQTYLLTRADLTFVKAVEAATAREMAAEKSHVICGNSSSAKPNNNLTNKVSASYQNRGDSSKKFIPPKSDKLKSSDSKPSNVTPRQSCFGCGGKHWKSDCPFKNAKCYSCQQVGHISKVCRNKSKGNGNYHNKPKSSENSNTNYSDEYIYNSHGPKPKPFVTNMLVNGCQVSFEVDTGASRSIMCLSSFNHIFHHNKPIIKPTSLILRKYGNEPMSMCGEVDVKVSFDTNSSKDLILIIVRDDGPNLLGRDWMYALNFPINKLVPSQLTVNKVSSTNKSVDRDKLNTLLNKFSDLFKPGLGTLKDNFVKIDVDPTVPPKFCKARPVPYALRSKLDDEIDRLLQEGIIEPVNYSEWACPVVPVIKPNGSLRLCGDYKLTVNRAILVDSYPIPKARELFSTFVGSKYFSKLDMSQAYAQLRLDEESKVYTTINTHRGLFRYTRLCFGVSSAPAIFQRTMESLLKGVAHCYLDDIPVPGIDVDSHLGTLEKVLNIMQNAGLKLKKEKCSWLLPEISYLGYNIDCEGIHPTTEKVDAIVHAPEPKTVTELQAYLGLLNFYRSFLKNASHFLEPLNKLLRHSEPWIWGPEQRAAFKKSKDSLVDSKCLIHFDPTLPIRVTVDSSSYGIGAVLEHIVEKKERPVMFVSRTLNGTERNYSQLEKEALAMIFALKKFHFYIYGHKFKLVTDHKPLLGIFSENKPISPMSSGRIQRWSLMLQAYQFELVHKSGKKIPIADALSRLPMPSHNETVPIPAEWVYLVDFLEKTPVTSEKIAEWTVVDPILSQVKKYCLEGWPTVGLTELKSFSHRKNELSIIDGCLLWGHRVVVPSKGRSVILSELHSEHVGASRMKELARSYVWWPGLDEELENLVQKCTYCLAHRHAPPRAALHPWEWPDKPWHRVHIDYAGPIKNTYFLILVDAHSKWIEVFPTTTITSRATINILRSCFARWGIPVVLVSDNGTQFVSKEFDAYISQLGIKHIKTAFYKPSTNGMAESTVKIFKNACKDFVGENMREKLDKFLFKHRITPHTTTGVSPAELMQGRTLRSVFDLLKPANLKLKDAKETSEIKERVEKKQERQKHYFSRGKKSRILDLCLNQNVMVRNFGKGAKWLPAKVIKRTGPLSYHCLTETGFKVKRHQDQIWRYKKNDSPATLPQPKRVIPDLMGEEEETKELPEEIIPEQVVQVPNVVRRTERIRKPPDRLDL